MKRWQVREKSAQEVGGSGVYRCTSPCMNGEEFLQLMRRRKVMDLSPSFAPPM